MNAQRDRAMLHQHMVPHLHAETFVYCIFADSVGLLATLARQFAHADIPCNVVAGYHHDHLFVPTGQAELALHPLSSICVPAPAGPNLPG